MESKIIQTANETKRWFFERINHIDKHLAKISKRKREKTQINKIRDEQRKNISRRCLRRRG
jgi:hypothetical protein